PRYTRERRMKRKLVIAGPLLARVARVAWVLRPKREAQGEAFVSEKVAPLLNSIAQVREQVGMVHYGERVDVIAKRNDYVKVRTSAGVVGWVETRKLMKPPRWRGGIKLLDRTRGLPVQPRGRTKVSTNCRFRLGGPDLRLYHSAPTAPVAMVGPAP